MYIQYICVYYLSVCVYMNIYIFKDIYMCVDIYLFGWMIFFPGYNYDKN